MTFRRVVRGGSWINNQDNARASYRNNNSPDNRNNNIGFRVCCVFHIDPLFSGSHAPAWEPVLTAPAVSYLAMERG